MTTTYRADPALWPRFEALSAKARVFLTHDVAGWSATVRLPGDTTPIVCLRSELLDAIVALINESDERPGTVKLVRG